MLSSRFKLSPPRRLAGVAASIAALVAVTGVSFAAHTASAQTQPTYRLLYFAPTQPLHPERQPLTQAQWESKGVKIVHSFADLRAATGPGTDAIILDGETLAQVDRG